MVQHKHQKKSIPKKQPQIKKNGKKASISEFCVHLDVLGLQIVQVTADGNCFFRALADQLEGNEDKHEMYRNMVVQYIMKNRETFEPFVEDEVPFGEYCKTMDKNGTWAGHIELQAASLATHCNICIHRNMSPRWYIQNFNDQKTRMIHLSYHDEEHYNSVRSKDDPCNGPARPIIIKADADISAVSQQAKVSARKPEVGAGTNVIPAGSIKYVMACSGCESVERVEEVLQQLGGDVDVAIEFLIAEQGTDECLTDSAQQVCQIDDKSDGTIEKGKCEQVQDEVENCASKEDFASNSLKQDKNPQQVGQKIPKNKVCPCGSKKKYKFCCGSATEKHSSNFMNNQIVDYRDGRKDRKPKRRGAPAKIAPSCGSDGGLADMGALCI